MDSASSFHYAEYWTASLHESEDDDLGCFDAMTVLAFPNHA